MHESTEQHIILHNSLQMKAIFLKVSRRHQEESPWDSG